MSSSVPSAIAHLRQNYTLQALNETEVDPDPVRQFRIWFDQAVAAELPEPNAMTLATATKTGMPSARIVLLKGVDDCGFVFYTNYESRKARELAENPQAALIFLWHGLERQVRVEGTVEKVTTAEADAYFESRPLESRLGAWTSPQSQVIPNRTILTRRFQELQQQYDQQPIPRPPHWGGYRVLPQVIEFWQGRPGRLHDRLCYKRDNDRWEIVRLAP